MNDQISNMGCAIAFGILGLMLSPLPIIGWLFPIGEILIGIHAQETVKSKKAGKTLILFGCATILWIGLVYTLLWVFFH